MEFFIDIILPAALVHTADNLTTIICCLSRNLGASASWNPQGLFKPVQGMLHLCLFWLRCIHGTWVADTRHLNISIYLTTVSRLLPLHRRNQNHLSQATIPQLASHLHVADLSPATCSLMIHTDRYHWPSYHHQDLQWLLCYKTTDYTHNILKLAHSDCHLPQPCNKHLDGTQFSTYANAKQTVTSWPKTLDSDLFYVRIDALMPRGDKCTNANGDYVEVWCVPSATCMPLTHPSLSKLAASKCLLARFSSLLRTV
jgi:hypothetical protein